MDRLLADLAPQAALFMLIATRLSAMMAVAPVFGSRSIPVRVKAGLVVLISWISLPIAASQGGQVPDSVIGLSVLAVKEAIIGVAFGLVAQFLFAAVQTAGSFIDMSAGFAVSQTLDPTSNVSVSVLGRWYNLIAITCFLAMGGHQLLVAGVVRSFTLAHPLADPDLSAVISGVLERADDIFLVVVQIGAPILGALLITDVTLGVISRAVPQMNIFIVGLPLKIVVALAGSAILLPAFVALTNSLAGRMLSDLSQIMRAAGAG
ncbi:flagellar biosynthetic protein FliR [Miltoncostaea marina]|uniref:flagellar biosynthetic protein FliR n=1 Tax=Miltoncostaea marina TaxID=2843215 RepID=UPI001C3DE733|nr:flagellar biosynthetic protein FliR [Miltoncostaea marina]